MSTCVIKYKALYIDLRKDPNKLPGFLHFFPKIVIIVLNSLFLSFYILFSHFVVSWLSLFIFLPADGICVERYHSRRYRVSRKTNREPWRERSPSAATRVYSRVKSFGSLTDNFQRCRRGGRAANGSRTRVVRRRCTYSPSNKRPTYKSDTRGYVYTRVRIYIQIREEKK